MDDELWSKHFLFPSSKIQVDTNSFPRNSNSVLFTVYKALNEFGIQLNIRPFANHKVCYY